MLLDGGIMIKISPAALRLHCCRAAGLPFLPSICSYSSACYACSHAVRSVQPAWQTWSHKQKKQMLSDGSSNPLLARSSVFTGIYHLWHSAFRPFFFRASSASSRPATWAHRLTTACLWKIKESMSGRVVVVVWYGSMVSISLKEHM